MRGYDSWKLDTPDNHLTELGKCTVCKQPVYTEDHYMEFAWHYIHDGCLEDYKEEVGY